jgi:hypothetical protein
MQATTFSSFQKRYMMTMRRTLTLPGRGRRKGQLRWKEEKWKRRTLSRLLLTSARARERKRERWAGATVVKAGVGDRKSEEEGVGIVEIDTRRDWTPMCRTSCRAEDTGLLSTSEGSGRRDESKDESFADEREEKGRKTLELLNFNFIYVLLPP